MRLILDHLHKFSDWLRVVKAVTVRNKSKRKSCEATFRREAEMTIIKIVQHDATLSQEVLCLQHYKEMGLESKLNKLSPLMVCVV